MLFRSTTKNAVRMKKTSLKPDKYDWISKDGNRCRSLNFCCYKSMENYSKIYSEIFKSIPRLKIINV